MNRHAELLLLMDDDEIPGVSYVAPFSATLTGVYPDQQLTVLDSLGTVVAQTDVLHETSGGSPDLCPVTITLEEALDTISTPDGPRVLDGFDLVFAFNNTDGAARQLGILKIGGWRLGSSVEKLDHWTTCAFTNLAADSTANLDYPGTAFSPVNVFYGGGLDIGISCLIPRHSTQRAPVTACRISRRLDSGSSPVNQTRCWFQLTNLDGTEKATLEAGETATYRVCVRLQEHDADTVQDIADAPENWIWLCEPYQEYFQGIYGKPDYRSMGGRDGRIVYSKAIAQEEDQELGNERGWRSDPDVDPTSGSGFGKVAADFLDKANTWGVERVIITAWSGLHYDSGSGLPAPNYPFRFATGVLELNATAINSAAPAVLAMQNDGKQVILWWGHAGSPELSETWDGTPEGNETLEPDVAGTMVKARAEGDLAVNGWGVNGLGLDALLDTDTPWHHVAIIMHHKARWPGTLVIGEMAMPDYLMVLMPSYLIEQVPGENDHPFHLANFILPGNEILLQRNEATPEEAQELADLGFTPVSAWSGDVSEVTDAADRWTELGQSAIHGFDGPLIDDTSRVSRVFRVSRTGR